MGPLSPLRYPASAQELTSWAVTVFWRVGDDLAGGSPSNSGSGQGRDDAAFVQAWMTPAAPLAATCRADLTRAPPTC